MVNELHNINPDAKFSVSETCKLLGIHRNTLYKYTMKGIIKCGVRSSTHKRFYLGSEIIDFWNNQF